MYKWLGKIEKEYEQIWKLIIRPNRFFYSIKDLGPKIMKIHEKIIERQDIQLKNNRNQTIQCSFFKQGNQKKPCIIYLHANSSSRIQSLQLLSYLIQINVNLFTFDFAGCGMSEGQYISLGWYQSIDLKIITKYVRQNCNSSAIGLWGRSMGAVTALMYVDSDQQIGCMVLDSPFSSLKNLILDICSKHSYLPQLIISIALKIISGTIKQKAKFDIYQLDPLNKKVKKCFSPVLFIVGNQDEFVEHKHSQALFNKYAGEKILEKVKGGHNSQRPRKLIKRVMIFIKQKLNLNKSSSEEIRPLNDPQIIKISKQTYIQASKNRVTISKDFYWQKEIERTFIEQKKKIKKKKGTRNLSKAFKYIDPKFKELQEKLLLQNLQDWMFA